MEVPTMRIRFVDAEGGHEGLINTADFDPARHIPLDEEGRAAKKPKATEAEAPPKAKKPKATD